MKRHVLFITISIALVIAYGIKQLRQPAAQEGCRIAILTPVTHAALQEIIAGFQETMTEKMSCTFDVYNAHGDRALLRNQAEKIVLSDYDLALAVATQPSLIMKEVLAQRSSSLPVVCTAVDDPVKHGLIDSMQSSGNSITVVTEYSGLDHYHKQLDALTVVMPQVKKLLLVYSPSVMLDREKYLLAAACAQHGIELTVVPIYAIHELAHRVGSMISGHDCVIILKDNMIVSAIETLVTVCKNLRVPLYASDLNSLQAGATYAYGVHERQFGELAAHQAYAILHDGKQPSEVPSSSVSDAQFKIGEVHHD